LTVIRRFHNNTSLPKLLNQDSLIDLVV